MEKIIVYVNDTAHALQALAPMCQTSAASANASVQTQWIVVACPPRLTRHISKWLTYSARLQWREKWSANVFTDLRPLLCGRGGQMKTLTAEGSLVEMTDRLLKTHGVARVLDARLALVGQDMLPVTREQSIRAENRWVLPSAMVGMGTLMALASE